MLVSAKMRIFADLTQRDCKTMNKKHSFIGWLALLLLLVGCQPKTDIEKIDALKKQVNKDMSALNDLDANTIGQLEKDFIFCDSLLQYLPKEEVEEAFPKLRLINAYLQQFQEVRPIMHAEMDSTLARLDLLKGDVESHYLADSLVEVYLEDETQQVEKLTNQVEYFKDRLGNCRKDLDDFKKKK
jgi:hypothetical protein